MNNHLITGELGLDDRIAWVVDDVVALLRNATMDSVLRDFARKKGRRDPVVHFYETFLAEYDPKLRKSRGVYYTPDAVVSYIVRSVDWLLKEKFGLKRGLADESKIKTDKGEVHRVLILDPAVGTGTFLFEVIDLIHSRFKKQKGMWSGYVREHLLPRLFGFELMMAPYAIAHMKLGLELAELGYDFESDERLGIYLTNTLEEAEETTRNLFAQWLSEEARAANEVKKELPIMVVVGNPPYSYASFNASECVEFVKPGQRYGVVTRQGKRVERTAGPTGVKIRRKTFIGKLLEDYYQMSGEPLGERNPRGLQDDYVKFIRFAQWKIEQTGSGILGFISNHSYLDNPTFGGMRRHLMRTFSEAYVVDLHGNLKKKEKSPDGSNDRNVFDIQSGVCVGLFVKEERRSGPTVVHHAEVYGTREAKYEWLGENDVTTVDWRDLEVRSPFYLFIPEKRELRSEYEGGWTISAILPLNGVGMQTARDHVVVDFQKEPLLGRVTEFRDSEDSDTELCRKLSIPVKKGWSIGNARKLIRAEGDLEKHICRISYRPFDERLVFYHDSLVWRTVKKLMVHLTGRENLALCFIRRSREKTASNFFVARWAIDKTVLTPVDNANVAPLYIYQDAGIDNLFWDGRWAEGKEGRRPNLSAEFVEEFAKRIRLDFVSDGRGDDKGTFGPEDVFDYIYGVLHSPEYRRRYAEFLKIDFPRVPWPKGRGIFREVAKVGGELVKLHLMEAEALENEKRWPMFGVVGESVVEKGYPEYVADAEKADKGRVYINKDQWFEGVQPDIWEFHIGGYQVCEKWLKDRRGRELSFDDIRHYQKVVVALGETIRLMKERCLVEMFEA